MRIPKTVTIAGYVVKVIYKRGLVCDGVECWGVYDYNKNVIYLKTGMEKTRKEEVFLHECIHAISDILGLKLSEKAVNLLGVELLALLRNNKIKI
jgi:hypothetical protein